MNTVSKKRNERKKKTAPEARFIFLPLSYCFGQKRLTTAARHGARLNTSVGVATEPFGPSMARCNHHWHIAGCEKKLEQSTADDQILDLKKQSAIPY